MKQMSSRLAAMLVVLGVAAAASAQTVDEVVNKSLAAVGGRAALGKLKSRSMVGTITLATPGGDITGSVEILNAAPNKVRTLIKADLSALGLGPVTLDQRFDGKTGYIIDTIQGNRDMTGGQLESLRNGSFPSPLLTYKEMGIVAKLDGKERVGEREANVLVLEPPSGPSVRMWIDAETNLLLKSLIKLDVPQLGREVEQTSEFFDYREVDGIKLPFRVTASSVVQRYTIEVTKVEHNVPVDEALFSKPAAP